MSIGAVVRPYTAAELAQVDLDLDEMAGADYDVEMERRLLATIADRDTEIEKYRWDLGHVYALKVETLETRVREQDTEIARLRQQEHEADVYFKCANANQERAQARIAQLEAERDEWKGHAEADTASMDEANDRVEQLEAALRNIARLARAQETK